MRSVLHKPSFEEEEVETVGNQSWFDRTRGSVILLWIPSVLFFSVLDRRCCATCWGRDLQIGLQLVSLKYLPHTYSCTCSYSKEKQYKQGLCRFWITGESNFYWGKMHEMLKRLSLFLLLFSLYNYYFIFIMAKWAWWVTLQGEEKNEDAQDMWNIYLTELTKHWTKMQELSSIFIEPNFAFCSVWLLVRLSPSWSKESRMSIRMFTLLLGCILFIPYKRLVDNKYSKNI